MPGACFGAQVKDTDAGKAWLEAAETAHMRAMDAASAAGSFASQLAAQGLAAREANPVNEEDAGGFPVYVQTPGIQCLICRDVVCCHPLHIPRGQAWIAAGPMFVCGVREGCLKYPEARRHVETLL